MNTELLELICYELTRWVSGSNTPDSDAKFITKLGSFLADRRAQLAKELEQIDQVLKEIAYYD